MIQCYYISMDQVRVELLYLRVSFRGLTDAITSYISISSLLCSNTEVHYFMCTHPLLNSECSVMTYFEIQLGILFNTLVMFIICLSQFSLNTDFI